jgi:hypothetical protein
MPKPSKDEERENRIANEIIVDCYDEYEVAMGWYCSLTDALDFPFEAMLLGKGNTKKKKRVEVLDMADEHECRGNMLVEVRESEDDDEFVFSVPLSDLELVDKKAKRAEIFGDWLYWLGRGNTISV